MTPYYTNVISHDELILPLVLTLTDISEEYNTEMLDRTAAQLSNEYSLKVGTIEDYQGMMRAMEKTLSKPPPYTPLEVRRYLAQLTVFEQGGKDYAE